MDEAGLMVEVSRGNREAFTELATHFLPMIERFALRVLHRPALAEEVAQEALLRLWQQANRYDPAKARLTTWLHRIAHNLSIDVLRRERLELSEEPVELAVAVEDTTEELSAQVRAGLAQLGQQHRTALALTYYQGLSNREAAEVMGLSTRALESLLVRARTQLKTLLMEVTP